jgi:glycosyltransferase involved in cell wall biosynthesis
MFQVLVSVIIPAYNAEATIGEAIESVLSQTYANLEIIVVDDGSEDNTCQVIEQQFPMVLLKRCTNHGPSYARNRGVEVSRGQWIAFLDADDAWHPDKISQQIDVASTDAAIGLVASDWIRGGKFDAVPKALPVSEVTYLDLLVLNRFQTSTVLVLHDILNELQGFDKDVDGAEDWDLWLRVAQISRVVKIDCPLVMYRDVETGYSKNVWRVYETMLPMLDKHRAAGQLRQRDFQTIEAWHHLRFALAFVLMKQYRSASAAFRPVFSRRLILFTAPAAGRYFLPFLWQRYRKRKSS